MSNIVDIGCTTTLDIPSEKVLGQAAKAGLDVVAVVGWDEEGGLYFASSTGRTGDVLLLLELAKKELLP